MQSEIPAAICLPTCQPIMFLLCPPCNEGGYAAYLASPTAHA